MKIKGPHHRGSHDSTSLRLRTTWAANPATRCGFCALTYDEGVHTYGEAGAKWAADHYPPGNLDGRYRPAHQHCNSRAGAIASNRKRNPVDEQW